MGADPETWVGIGIGQSRSSPFVFTETSESVGLPKPALKWLATCPLWLDGPGWRVLHAGCDPVGGAESTRRSDLLNLRRWPNENPENPFWWEVYTGSPMVIYGHDARRGLVDRRPHSLGLDTGCVYGGHLTGFIIESGCYRSRLSVPIIRSRGTSSVQPSVGPSG